jgi:uncharacterized protein (DUF58 family)
MQPPEHAMSTRELLRRVRWAVLRPLAQRPNGDERSRLAGPGIDFARVREYQPGDDVRRIDWRLTARSDRAFVREAHDDRGVDVWLVVDTSSSVDWGTALSLKRDLAIEFTAAAGQLLGRRGNRLGLVLFADEPKSVIPPSAGHAHLERIVGRLRAEPRQATHGPTDLATALSVTRRMLRRQSVIVVLSDFLVPDGWANSLRMLAARHEVVAVRIRDPRESSLPDIGLVTFEDPESGAQQTFDTGDARLRERFSHAANLQSQNIDAALTRCGAAVVVVSTDEPLLPRLIRFLDARRPGRRGGAGRPHYSGPSPRKVSAA